MRITEIKLKNWKNFLDDVAASFQDVTYVIGNNGAGKSNLIAALAFLKDICTPQIGLQNAIQLRGGYNRLRNHLTEQGSSVSIVVNLLNDNDEPLTYEIVFSYYSDQEAAILYERLFKGTELLIERESFEYDQVIPLTKSFLETFTYSKKEFSSVLQETLPEIINYFAAIQHIPSNIEMGRVQNLLARMEKCPEEVREKRLEKISVAMMTAIPFFVGGLQLYRDKGVLHIRTVASAYTSQSIEPLNEEDFSKGTLRLLEILWNIQDVSGLLIIEEPETSLHPAVVAELPLLIDRVQRATKRKRQVILVSHSEALLSNPGIYGDQVLVIESGSIRKPSDAERIGLDAGLTVADIVFPQTVPECIQTVCLW